MKLWHRKTRTAHQEEDGEEAGKGKMVDSKQRKLTTEGRGTAGEKKVTFRLNEETEEKTERGDRRHSREEVKLMRKE